MKIISHRGAAGLALENTLESIRVALKYPVHAIEVDVRRTADGKLVLLHDHHTGHVAGKTLLVHNCTLEELRAIKLNNGERIPTLDEALKLIGGKTRVMLDLKSPDVADAIIESIKKHPKTTFFVSGRQYADARKIHEALPEVIFLVQHHFDPFEIVHTAKRMGADGICLNYWLMNPLTYRLARRKGLDVLVYTLNHRWARRFFEWFYPDATIITNHPEKML